MVRLIMALFSALITATKGIVVVGLAIGVGILIARFLCNINEAENYSWISGLWHGLFVVPNYVRWLFDTSILYKAQYFSTMYNVLWWIVVILQAPTILTFLFKIVIEPLAVAFFVINEKE